MVVPVFFVVVGEESAVWFEGCVDGVVGHVEVEGFFSGYGFFEFADGFAGDGFGEIDFLAVVFVESGDVPDVVAGLAPVCGEIFVTVV